MTDEGLTATTRTSSVAFGDTFSFKEKGEKRPSPVREKVVAEQPDEGLTVAARTSSVCFADTFS
jgi:hypothetical protein